MNLGKITISQVTDEIIELYISGILSHKIRERIRQMVYAELTRYDE